MRKPAWWDASAAPENQSTMKCDVRRAGRAALCVLFLSLWICPKPAAAQILPQVKTVFVIAMENHNFTQPSPTSSPQQILNNAAAPYINRSEERRVGKECRSRWSPY